MELSKFEQTYQALLSSTERRIAGVRQAMGAENEGLVTPLCRIRDLLKRQGEAVLAQGRLLQIGVMGQIKSGKSTFVNALLFDGKPVLPKGATPKTANLTVITYGDEDLLRVTFYTREEWNQLTETAEHGNPTVSLPARELLDQARVVGGGDDCIGSGVRDIHFADSASLERQLGQFVGEAGVLAPFVKNAELRLHNELLRGLAIVDTPGLNDRVYSRVRQTQSFVEKCDVVFYLSAASDFMDTVDSRLLFEQMPEQGVARLVLIASKYDSALMDAVWMKNGLTAAHADSRKRLNRQAQAMVDRFVESTGSTKLADTVRACLPPLFVSSLVESMVGRSYFSYTDEERRIYDGLASHGELSDEWLREISSFDKVRALYRQIVEEKQATLERKGEQVIKAIQTLLTRECDSLDARLSGRSRLIEVPDEMAIEAIRTTYNRSQEQLAVGFRRVFSALEQRLRQAQEDASRALETSAAEAAALSEHRSIRNLPKVERISVSKWYLPWTWGKYQELRTTVQEVYQYYAVEEASGQISDYARRSTEQITRSLRDAMDVDDVRSQLLSHALLVLGDNEAAFDPAYLRSLTEDAINGLRLVPPEVDIRERLEQITDRFGREAVGAKQMEDLKTLVEEAVAEIRQALFDDMSAQIGTLSARIPHMADTLQSGMTATVQAELTEAEDRTQNRELYVAQIARARKCLAAE